MQGFLGGLGDLARLQVWALDEDNPNTFHAGGSDFCLGRLAAALPAYQGIDPMLREQLAFGRQVQRRVARNKVVIGKRQGYLGWPDQTNQEPNLGKAGEDLDILEPDGQEGPARQTWQNFGTSRQGGRINISLGISARRQAA